ncbi:hypothetical protein TEA_006983 [Camellia sinensis var. sinensis]|uniref:Uncharacterized protein n=1 Tax=Camellia sinensis var. sinensis TaxID=542762 RepID=A0A4S4EA35_CAMSN|nr:hypothetical protein TEA_006983 [Camellia sinensis var. sinensis]
MTAGGARLPDRRTSKKIICDAAADAAAGFALFTKIPQFSATAATFVCPLDVIKTRLQVHGLPEAHHSGPKGSIIITSLQNIIRTEGLKGLYRGLSPTLVALLPNWAVSITFLELLLKINDHHYGYTTEEFLVPTKESACGFLVSESPEIPSFFLLGKAISVFLVSSSHCGKTTILEATSLLIVLISFNISYCDNTVNNSSQLTFGANMIAASGVGAVTAIAANPLWVVKTRLQGGWILLSAVSF